MFDADAVGVELRVLETVEDSVFECVGVVDGVLVLVGVLLKVEDTVLDSVLERVGVLLRVELTVELSVFECVGVELGDNGGDKS